MIISDANYLTLETEILVIRAIILFYGQSKVEVECGNRGAHQDPDQFLPSIKPNIQTHLYQHIRGFPYSFRDGERNFTELCYHMETYAEVNTKWLCLQYLKVDKHIHAKPA